MALSLAACGGGAHRQTLVGAGAGAQLFEMTGASISHAAFGDDVMHIVVPLAFTALALASWQLRPVSRKLQASFAITGT